MMSGVEPLAILAAAISAAAVGFLGRLILPLPRRLHDRVHPYVAPKLARLPSSETVGILGPVFGPMMRDLAEWLGGLVDRSGSQATLLKLRQAGWHRGVDEQQMIARYRMGQLRTLAGAVGLAIVVGHLLGANPTLRLGLVVLGAVFGITRPKGRLERAIVERRDLMRIEIYTVNQLLAMRVRAGGGVIQAVKATTARGHGEVVDELKEALRLHRAGWSASEAFRRIAELTPEPFCSRTYRLLATAEERGADLGRALLALSEDVRETRRESMRRNATKRRAAMLIPTIAVLAPVLILFVAAPLPYLITSWQ